MKNSFLSSWLFMAAITSLVAPGWAYSSDNLMQKAPVGSSKIFEFAFDSPSTGWKVGFADYPVNEDEFYELRHEYKQLPEPLQSKTGLQVSGINHSDDLFMYVTRKFEGLVPNSGYTLEFEVVIATDAPTGCAGTGGSPGESVYVKSGATLVKPKAQNDGTGYLRMNLDKGEQSNSGKNAFVIGNLANGRPCIEERQYVAKPYTSASQRFEFTTDFEGSLWLIFGTDSGFESLTAIYYLSGKLTATLLN